VNYYFFANIHFCLQEAYISDLDAKSGASLKLTILNAAGRIWTMVAGGGASVIYAYVNHVTLLGMFSILLQYLTQRSS
jgi:succinyl-CoA synthetase beta subunit